MKNRHYKDIWNEWRKISTLITLILETEWYPCPKGKYPQFNMYISCIQKKKRKKKKKKKKKKNTLLNSVHEVI